MTPGLFDSDSDASAGTVQGMSPCKCGCKDRKVIETPDLQHWGKEVCANCETWFRWIRKPDSEKIKRPAAHTDLVRKFSRGFCEICLLPESDLPPRQTLEAQHVVEYQDDGEPTRENIMIVCTKCHKLVHWLRTHATPRKAGRAQQ